MEIVVTKAELVEHCSSKRAAALAAEMFDLTVLSCEVSAISSMMAAKGVRSWRRPTILEWVSMPTEVEVKMGVYK